MNGRFIRRFALAGVVGLGGCAYYNSMYGAVHLARSAERAERLGRTFDAQSDWAQVAAKAETTYVRHPQSKWAIPARFLAGKAYQRLNSCERAIGPLELVRAQSRDSATVTEARSLLGDCYVKLNDPAAAAAAFRPLISSPDSAVRHAALYAVGMSELSTGDPANAAVHLLASGDPRASAYRVIALARSGRPAPAAALADTLLARHDSTVAWDSVFAAVGEADPELGSALVDTRAAEPGVTAQQKAQWLVDDARRLLAPDTVRAFARFAQADSLQPGSESARQAAVGRADVWAARAVGPVQLDSAIGYLARFASTSGTAAYQVGAELTSMRWLRAELDSLTPVTPTGDIRTFLAGEFARDSVAARKLAAVLFTRLAVEAPQSPYAPKALLALARLEPTRADSIADVLHTQYAASPYVLAISGALAPRYASL
ncbi:MAG: tetratricopeptide repeat protein, partial [Gemmatimonadales bacterium]